MKKIFITSIISLLFSISLFAQERPFTVGYWVIVENDVYRDRAINEIARQLEISQEWNFEPSFQDWETDIHLIVNGMPDSGSGYAWGVTFTPIHQPVFTNGTIGISEDSISGVNWASRQAVIYIEEQLYILLDSMTENDT